MIVGPNNVSKSTALGELASSIASGRFLHNQRTELVFKSGDLEMDEDDAIVEWSEQFRQAVAPDPVNNPSVRKYGIGSIEMLIEPTGIPNYFRHQRQHVSPFLISNGMSAPFEGQIPNFYTQQLCDGIARAADRKFSHCRSLKFPR